MSARAQLRALRTTNMDDLEGYMPDDPERFHVVVRAMVGPRDEAGEESG